MFRGQSKPPFNSNDCSPTSLASISLPILSLSTLSFLSRSWASLRVPRFPNLHSRFRIKHHEKTFHCLSRVVYMYLHKTGIRRRKASAEKQLCSAVLPTEVFAKRRITYHKYTAAVHLDFVHSVFFSPFCGTSGRVIYQYCTRQHSTKAYPTNERDGICSVVGPNRSVLV